MVLILFCIFQMEEAYLLPSKKTSVDPSTICKPCSVTSWLSRGCMYMPSLKKPALVVTLILLCLLVLYVITEHRGYGNRSILFTTGVPPLGTSNLVIKTSRILYESHVPSFSSSRMRYKHTKRCLPGCIVIGARKAGTRALLTYLDLHPHVRTAKNEVHFFDDDENYMEGLDWYRKKMPFIFDGHMAIEKTPAYFVCDYVPERIYAMNSTVRLLLVVRNPVDRAMSDYLQIKDNKDKKGKWYDTFENLALSNITGEVSRDYAAIKRSIYYRHMLPWLRKFPLSQIYIVSAEQLVQDPYAVMKNIETYMGLAPRISKNMFFYNTTRKFFCIRNGTENKCLAESKGRQHPPINPLVRQKLDSYFHFWNQKFYHLVKQDFGWP